MKKSQNSQSQDSYIQQTERNEIDLRSFLLLLNENKLLIALVSGVLFCCSLLYFYLKPRQYESNALIQVENKANNLGEFDSLPKLFDVSASPSDIQKALMDSRFILEPVIEKLNLNITAKPHYFPVLGAFVDKNTQAEDRPLTKPWLGLSRFAWGGEKIKITQMDLPAAYMGKNFQLVAGKNDHYQLYDTQHKLILTGNVGELAKSKPDQPIKMSILVSALQANPGAEFTIQHNFVNDIINQLQKKLSIVEAGSSDQLNIKTGILKISLIDTNPAQLSAIVNMITRVALQEDTKNKTLEAAKTLDFLNKQLPEVKNALNQAEIALNDYRAKNGKLNLSVEIQLLLTQATDIEKQIGETRLKKEELLQYYTPRHPFVLELDSREKKLREELTELQGTMKKLPAEDQIALSLARDVKVKNELYMNLSKKMQELQVIAAGTVSDIRILSFAKNPDKPLPEQLGIKLIGSLFIAIGLSVLISLIRRALHRKIQDPRWIEQNLNINIAAIIPFSKKQSNTNRLISKGLNNELNILAFTAPHDLSVEALRSLRTHLQFSSQLTANNIIAITGISPGVGKSFVTSNFAYLLAEAGKRTLLIDSDIRRGCVNRYFNVKKSPGLSEFLAGSASALQVIQSFTHPNLDILASGNAMSKSAELLSNDRFDDLIALVSQKYDFIIFDTAPILAVTDGVIVAKKAHINFLLIGSGMHHAEEIEFAIKRLNTNMIKIHGVIHNNLYQEAGAYGKYQYRYYYDYEKV